MYNFFIVFLSVVFLDRLTKYLAIKLLTDSPLSLINNVLYLNLVYNKGGAFGVLQNHQYIFIFAFLVLIGAFIYYYKKVAILDNCYKIALGAILGGSVGNIIDRIIRGSVTDFIDFRIWPCFNVADSAITIAVTFLFIKLILTKDKKRS